MMKNKVGVDIVHIPRIKKALENPTFLKRIYTEKEITYCQNKNNPFNSFAGIYAAKEAFFKATGRGVTLAFHEVQVAYSESGAPVYSFNGAMQKYNEKASLSISHDGEYAVAFCILEENQ